MGDESLHRSTDPALKVQESPDTVPAEASAALEISRSRVPRLLYEKRARAAMTFRSQNYDLDQNAERTTCHDLQSDEASFVYRDSREANSAEFPPSPRLMCQDASVFSSRQTPFNECEKQGSVKNGKVWPVFHVKTCSKVAYKSRIFV